MAHRLPLHALNGPPVRLPQSPKGPPARPPQSLKQHALPDLCVVLNEDCLAQIAHLLAPCGDFEGFAATCHASKAVCAPVRAEHAALRKEGYDLFRLPDPKPRSALSIAPASLRSVRGLQHTTPSHLSVCDAYHGGMKLVSLASKGYEQWGRVAKDIVQEPMGVSVTPHYVRVGSGANERDECRGVTSITLDKRGVLLKTDGMVRMQQLNVRHLLGDSHAVGKD